MNPVGPPPMEPVWIALAESICDLLARERLKVIVLTELLEKHGILSRTEIDQAIAATPLAESAALLDDLRRSMQESVSVHYRKILQGNSSDLPIQ